ncbi:hypothetical protein [Pedobacter caeni]|uniref:BACON domain-containing protein n=1 Tax=Pedobacter caeni TaxID=288992 RepID=A0A1M5GZA8_9SPHI|nr:hypothetical protein [Pedobacter caeni]SHG09089.1 hypothetical protein SAMN04488522_104435 [Pedobacter caeni]
MNRLTKILSLSLILSLTLLFACKKDKDDAPSNGTHKVVFKAIGSAGTKVSTAVYTDGSGKTETFTSLDTQNWTSSEYTIPSSARSVHFGANGIGVDASSTLVVEIWVDGVKAADGKSTGKILSSSASLSF